MATLLLTDREHPEVVIARPIRARTRWWARAHGFELDRALAAGACPDVSAVLSVRAELLLKESTRREAAHSLRRLVDQASRRFLPTACSVPLCRRKIRRATGSLLDLANRLESPQPVDVRGVALVRMLICAGNGPLYDRPFADDLELAVCQARDALEIEP